MSKIFSVAIAIVVVTVTMEPRISRHDDPKKIWRSAGAVEPRRLDDLHDTPLIAADSTTMAKPVWSQIMISISAGRLIGNAVAQATGLLPNAVQTAFSSPNCGWLGGARRTRTSR